MKIIINNSSMVPIYEQIMEQIKAQIISGELKENVAASNIQLMEEERRKEVEADLETVIQKGRRCGMKEEEIRSLFELIMEDEYLC